MFVLHEFEMKVHSSGMASASHGADPLALRDLIASFDFEGLQVRIKRGPS